MTKQEKITTSKGEFLLVDAIEKPNINTGIKLSEITEEQASEIVDKVMNNQHFQNYNFKSYNDRWVKTAIESLHSLLKSKGIHLFENPYGKWYSDFENANQELDWQLAEQKTFYNPYIFKTN